MFGINGGELLILIVIAIIVVGPERMPEYAKQFRKWVVGMRAIVDQGRNQLKEEVGDDVDWSQLDPRQYDPRRIVREALNEPVPPTRADATGTRAAVAGAAGVAATDAATDAATASTATDAPTGGATANTAGSPSAPFDSEAT